MEPRSPFLMSRTLQYSCMPPKERGNLVAISWNINMKLSQCIKDFVLRPEYCVTSRLMFLSLMPWLLASPSFKKNMVLSSWIDLSHSSTGRVSTARDISCIWMMKHGNVFMFSQNNQEHYGYTLPKYLFFFICQLNFHHCNIRSNEIAPFSTLLDTIRS